MGFFDKRREQAPDSDAWDVLTDLYIRRPSSRRRLSDWQLACSMIRQSVTQEAAATGDSTTVAVWIKYHEIPEPQPVLEDFLPDDVPAFHDSAWVLSEAKRRFEADWYAHPQRERERLEFVEVLKKEYARLRTEERAENLERQLGMWPQGVTLDSDVAEIEGFEWQVEAQNNWIERRVDALTNLLAEGLGALPLQLDGASGESIDRGTLDPHSIARRIETALTTIHLPIDSEPKVRAAYTPDSRQAVVEYELPDVKIVPRAKSFRHIKSRDQITETVRPASQIKSLYADTIAQLALLCLANIFASDDDCVIDVAVFNGIVDTLDPRSGQPIRPCLITVRVTRDTSAGINLAHVDPQACLKHLSAGVSKSPTELAPVRPVLEFSMVDPRFIAETDAMSAMDNRPNLMDLTPGEFETLIQNLFTKMGLEARQTRASRDGGVDCVAYDTRPIFGGKVVIQAKRYKNTVGVSAVRDLFGTLQNEGASKGILVTTSGYGAASFDFAQNKPIELIDGANLLYLLEEHAGITARIEPPEDWRDPIPDSAPLFPDDRMTSPQ